MPAQLLLQTEFAISLLTQLLLQTFSHYTYYKPLRYVISRLISALVYSQQPVYRRFSGYLHEKFAYKPQRIMIFGKLFCQRFLKKRF